LHVYSDASEGKLVIVTKRLEPTGGKSSLAHTFRRVQRLLGPVEGPDNQGGNQPLRISSQGVHILIGRVGPVEGPDEDKGEGGKGRLARPGGASEAKGVVARGAWRDQGGHPRRAPRGPPPQTKSERPPQKQTRGQQKNRETPPPKKNITNS